jgi:hypothetical protein
MAEMITVRVIAAAANHIAYAPTLNQGEGEVVEEGDSTLRTLSAILSLSTMLSLG